MSYVCSVYIADRRGYIGHVLMVEITPGRPAVLCAYVSYVCSVYTACTYPTVADTGHVLMVEITPGRSNTAGADAAAGKVEPAVETGRPETAETEHVVRRVPDLSAHQVVTDSMPSRRVMHSRRVIEGARTSRRIRYARVCV